MRSSRVLICAVLFFTTPSRVLHSQTDIPITTTLETVQAQFPEGFSYDDILYLLEILESGEADKLYSLEELEAIDQLLISLALEGASAVEVEEDLDLEKDIDELLNEKFTSPASFSSPAEIVLCRGWVGKQCGKTKRFVKKHKKAIIIGAAIIVATTSVIAAVAIASTCKKTPPPQKKNDAPPKKQESKPLPSPAPTLKVKEVLNEQVSTLKEHIVDDVVLQSLAHTENDLTFGEKIREVGAFLGHQALTEVAEIVELVPQASDGVNKIFPDSHPSKSLTENYQKLISSGHEKIDQAFSTEQSDLYFIKGKEEDFKTGMFPPPGHKPKGFNFSRFRQIIKAGQKTAVLADELGYTAREIAVMRKAGTLEKTVDHTFKKIASEPVMAASVQKYKHAKEFLNPHRGKYLSEKQAKSLLKEAGIQMPPIPKDIPKKFRVKLADKPGLKYVHPDHTYESVRIMPGVPHSPYPYQRKPYVVHLKDRGALDKFGNIVDSSSPEAHIPLEEFTYRGKKR